MYYNLTANEKDIIIQTAMRHGLYPAQAYEFVAYAFDYTMDKVQGYEQRRRLVTADEFIRVLLALTTREMGCMAAYVFQDWRIRTATDIGVIVLHLVDVDAVFDSDAIKYHKQEAEILQDFNSVRVDFQEKLRHDWSGGGTEIWQ